MQIAFNNVDFLNLTGSWDAGAFQAMPPLPPFSDAVVDYLDALFKELYRSPDIRQFPDVATFAFYCRRSNIMQIGRTYQKEDSIRLGRGVVFHIAPSNVPVNFAYSMLIGLLSGNLNIVRVPSEPFDQVNLIIDAMNRLDAQGAHSMVSNRTILLRYDRHNEATVALSSMADVRIIWGGDETIRAVRQHPLPPRSFDITFADRYSICVIDAKEFAAEENPEIVASRFYNDTYVVDQNACTSPHLVIWIGDKASVGKAQSVFWEKLNALVEQKYRMPPILAIDKLSTFYSQTVHMNGVRRVAPKHNRLWRIELAELRTEIYASRCIGGYFAEYHMRDLNELAGIVDRKFQTVSYYGFSKKEWAEFMANGKPSGIDRIVPIGQTMDFSMVWDGYDIIATLSRTVDLR